MSQLSLLWTLLRNLGAGPLNRSLVGWRTEVDIEPVSPAEAAAFAAVTGDPDSAYGMPGGPLPPLYIAKLIIPCLKQVWQMPDLNLNLLRMVHAGQSVNWRRMMKSNEPFRLEAIISDIRDTSAGELLEITGRCKIDGETAVKGVTDLIVRGEKGPTSRPKTARAQQVKEAFRIEIPTREGQQREYAKVSGDTNFIHTNELLAKAAGLPRTILHGACVLAMACNALCRRLAGGDIHRIEQIGCRFARPAIPGKPLTLIGEEGLEPNQAVFVMLDETGAPVLKQGNFIWRERSLP
jgi:acyl dehydratase